MSIYILLALSCLLLALFSYQLTINKIKRRVDYRESSIPAKVELKKFYYLIVVVMIILIGFRAPNVGIDTENYMRTYLVVSKYDFSDISGYTFAESLGFRAFMILCGKLRVSWQLFLIITAAIYVVPFAQLIYEESDNVFFCLLLMILSGIFTFPMSTIRQSVAIGVSIEAYRQEKKNRQLLSLLLIILASSFHFSASLCFVFWLLLRLPLNKNNWGVWVIVGIFTVAIGTNTFRRYLFQSIQLVGKIYEETATGGLLMEAFYLLTLFIGFLLVSDSNDFLIRYADYIKAIYLTAIIIPVVRIHPALFRTYLYFSAYEVILIPMILKHIRDQSRIIRILGYMGYMFAYSYLFLTQTLSANKMLIPYMFFWQV